LSQERIFVQKKVYDISRWNLASRSNWCSGFWNFIFIFCNWLY